MLRTFHHNHQGISRRGISRPRANAESTGAVGQEIDRSRTSGRSSAQRGPLGRSRGTGHTWGRNSRASIGGFTRGSSSAAPASHLHRAHLHVSQKVRKQRHRRNHNQCQHNAAHYDLRMHRRHLPVTLNRRVARSIYGETPIFRHRRILEAGSRNGPKPNSPVNIAINDCVSCSKTVSFPRAFSNSACGIRPPPSTRPRVQTPALSC